MGKKAASTTPCDLDTLLIEESNTVPQAEEEEGTGTARTFRIVPGKPVVGRDDALRPKNKDGDNIVLGPGSQVAMTAPRRMDASDFPCVTIVEVESNQSYCDVENDHPHVEVSFSGETVSHAPQDKVTLPLLQDSAWWEKFAKFKGKGLALKPLWNLHKVSPRVYAITAETCGRNRTDGKKAVTSLDCELHVYPSDVYRIEIASSSTYECELDGGEESSEDDGDAMTPGFRILRNGKVLKESDAGEENLDKGGDSIESNFFGNLEQAYKIVHFFSLLARAPKNFGSGMPGFYFKSSFSVLKGQYTYNCYWKELEDHRVAFVREVSTNLLLYDLSVSLCFGVRIAFLITLAEVCIRGTIRGNAQASGSYDTETIADRMTKKPPKNALKVSGDACVAELGVDLAAGADTVQMGAAICSGLGFEGLWKDEVETGGYLDCALWFKGVWVQMKCKAGKVSKDKKVMLARERMDQAWSTRLPGRYLTVNEAERFQQLKKDKASVQKLIKERCKALVTEEKAIEAARKKIWSEHRAGKISDELYGEKKQELRDQRAVLADERLALDGSLDRLAEINEQLDCLTVRKVNLKAKAKLEASLARKKSRLDELEAKVVACEAAIVDLDEKESEFRERCNEVHAKEIEENSGQVKRAYNQWQLDSEEKALIARRLIADDSLRAATKNRDAPADEIEEIEEKTADIERILADNPCEESDEYSAEDEDDEEDDVPGKAGGGEPSGEDEDDDDGDYDEYDDEDEDGDEEDDGGRVAGAGDDGSDSDSELEVTDNEVEPASPVRRVEPEVLSESESESEQVVVLPSSENVGYREQPASQSSKRRRRRYSEDSDYSDDSDYGPPMMWVGAERIIVDGQVVFAQSLWVPAPQPYFF